MLRLAHRGKASGRPFGPPSGARWTLNISVAASPFLENGSTSSFFSIRSGPGGILSGGSGVPSDCQNHGSGTVPHILHILYIMAYDTSSIWHMPYSAHPTYPLYMPYAISYILQFLFNAYFTYPAYPTYTLYGICHILHILHILDIMPYDTSSI